MVKIFVGNLPRETEQEELKALFAQYGTVTECAIIKNYAFVHMEDRKASVKAIKNLHLYKLHGTPINVEASHGKNHASVKLHVANVEKGADEELRGLFEEYGSVTECAVVKNFAFVHMSNSEEAMDAMKGLDNTEFQGKRIHVQISKSRPRHEEQEDYPPPPDNGYWPPRYPGERPEPPPPYMRNRYAHVHPGYPAPPLPPPPPRRALYPERPYENERERYSVVDYYEKYRARPYGMNAYEDQRGGAPPPPPPPPPPPASIPRDRLMTQAHDPYDRRPLPPPPSSYYGRDRSPLRRAPNAPVPPANNGYSYDRSRLSPVPRAPAYGVPRGRDPYAERLPPPPPARYAY